MPHEISMLRWNECFELLIKKLISRRRIRTWPRRHSNPRAFVLQLPLEMGNSISGCHCLAINGMAHSSDDPQIQRLHSWLGGLGGHLLSQSQRASSRVHKFAFLLHPLLMMHPCFKIPPIPTEDGTQPVIPHLSSSSISPSPAGWARWVSNSNKRECVITESPLSPSSGRYKAEINQEIIIYTHVHIYVAWTLSCAAKNVEKYKFVELLLWQCKK